MILMKFAAWAAYVYTLVRATILFGSKGFIMIVGATMFYAIFTMNREGETEDDQDRR